MLFLSLCVALNDQRRRRPTVFNVYKWRYSGVIAIKLTAGFFIFWKLIKWCRFVTYFIERRLYCTSAAGSDFGTEANHGYCYNVFYGTGFGNPKITVRNIKVIRTRGLGCIPIFLDRMHPYLTDLALDYIECAVPTLESEIFRITSCWFFASHHAVPVPCSWVYYPTMCNKVYA